MVIINSQSSQLLPERSINLVLNKSCDYSTPNTTYNGPLRYIVTYQNSPKAVC